ncbi:MAG: LysR family transcriptional regulator, partial [Burkholderiales bacterium]|nr:LysR family transcriptional regulator [Burkholderiales bacterium]
MNRLTLDALAVLDAIDRRGSFAQAADELHRVPSALTYTVQKLEDDLGVKVFDRSGHRAKLTPAGLELLKEGRHLLRIAADLESRVKRVATGWETELVIAVDAIISIAALYPIVARFYRNDCGTRLRLLSETLGGTWDALAGGRADLVVGASGDAPTGGGFASQPMGTMRFVFVVAPGHPLAALPEPLPAADILGHRAVAVADSARNLPPRTTGLLSGQDVLTVPTMQAKLDAHRMGLGVGFLPETLARTEAAAGRLVIREVAESKAELTALVAWRTANKGRALAWWIDA